MANKYWVGGTVISSIFPTVGQATWRNNPGASFFGQQGGAINGGNTLRITFSNLAGPIANGHTLYVTGVSGSAGTVAGLTFNSGSTTAGFFFVTTPRTVSVVMFTADSNTAATPPTASDSIFFTEGSSYQPGSGIITSTDVPTYANLDLTGFRGRIQFSMAITGEITLPNSATQVIISSNINLAANTIIDNNGVTNLDVNLNNLTYTVNGFTPPDNILCGNLSLLGTVNLSNKTIRAGTITAEDFSVINSGTSTLKCNTYVYNPFDTGNKNLYNVVGLKTSFGDYTYTQPLAGITYNSLGLEYINSIENQFDTIETADCTVNTLNIQYPESPQYQNSNLYSATPTTITKQGGGSVMLQVGFIQNYTFEPSGTFFSVGADYTSPELGNTNIRPSPSPLNFL